MLVGGEINKKFLKSYLNCNKYDIIIAVDKGLESLSDLEIMPSYIVGDFDSVESHVLEKYENLGIKIQKLIPEKDFTDTEAALDLAINLGSKTIDIIGAIGTRMDHTIANIHILKSALEKNIDARIINENNEVTLINKNTEIKNDESCKYISLIALTTEVTGITLKGFKYSLEDYTLKIGTSLGVSNEQIEEKAKIELRTGILIMIKSKD